MIVLRQVLLKYVCRESFMDIFLLINPIIFKFMNSKVLFLFVLILAFEVNTQVLSPTSQCLGNCSNCDLLSLTNCRSPLPCQWGFYDPFKNGTCVQTPSTQVILFLFRPQCPSSVKEPISRCVSLHQDGVDRPDKQYVSIPQHRASSLSMSWGCSVAWR